MTTLAGKGKNPFLILIFNQGSTYIWPYSKKKEIVSEYNNHIYSNKSTHHVCLFFNFLRPILINIKKALEQKKKFE